MARSLEIPAVVGVTDIMSTVKHGDMLILDALKGKVLINPDEETIAKYRIEAKRYEEEVCST
ncbi:MAG: PEP-utilizing enzyme [Erysipelotrichaceae bacterium]